jgi:hypothetical protein
MERLAARGNLPPAFAFDPLFDALRQQPQWSRFKADLTPTATPGR